MARTRLTHALGGRGDVRGECVTDAVRGGVEHWTLGQGDVPPEPGAA